jgi:hypothetical protein
MKKIVVFLAGTGLAIGCRSPGRSVETLAPPTTRPVEVLQKPVLDLTRSGVGFPLDTDLLPSSVSELKSLLQEAYKTRLGTDASVNVVVQGSEVHDLDRLEIDLSGQRINGSWLSRPPEDNRNKVSGMSFARVSELSYIADPLIYTGYSASMILQATDARLALIPGPQRNLSLVMYDCASGRAQIRIGLDDLEQGLVAWLRARGGWGAQVRSIGIRLNSESPYNLSGDLRVELMILGLPAAFQLVGRVDVDAGSNLHFTGLNAWGQNPAGTLVAAFVQTRLDRLNNKAAPFFKLPGDRVRVTDLILRLDQDLTIDVSFRGTVTEREKHEF